MATDNFCFYLQNRLIQTSKTGGQRYSDTSPFSIPWFNINLRPKASVLNEEQTVFYNYKRQCVLKLFCYFISPWLSLYAYHDLGELLKLKKIVLTLLEVKDGLFAFSVLLSSPVCDEKCLKSVS